MLTKYILSFPSPHQTDTSNLLENTNSIQLIYIMLIYVYNNHEDEGFFSIRNYFRISII